jgi:peptide/nickel transport system permease protein
MTNTESVGTARQTEITSTRKARRRAPRGLGVGLCFCIAGGILVLAIFGRLLAPQDPSAQSLQNVLAPPSGDHLLGTDALGRDVFSRTIVAAQLGVLGPLVIAAGSFVIGNLLGLWAGYRRGWVDSMVMRWVDLMWSVPTLLVLVVAAGAVGASYWLAVGLLVILSAPFDTRIIRGAVLEQAPRPYVEAARTIGVSGRRIAFLHIWPNVAPVAIANSFLVFASSLVALAGLSFLGLGAPPGTPDWGLMLAESQSMLFVNPVATLAPAFMIVITATVTNLIGDWFDEYLTSRRGAT